MSTLESIYRLLDGPSWNEIEPLLYLGSVDAFQDTHFMKRVKAVVSITQIPTEEFNMPAHIVAHLDLCLPDSEDADISQYFKESHDFISRHITDGHGVFVHCSAGVSRSATLVAAFLMQEYDLDAWEALEQIKRNRPCIRPNEGFLRQLLKLEKKIVKNRD